MPLNREPVDARELLENVIDLYSPVAEERQIAVHLRPIYRGLIVADVARLRQVLANLLDNALKYTPRHGNIWIEIDARPARVRDGDRHHLPRRRSRHRGGRPAAHLGSAVPGRSQPLAIAGTWPWPEFGQGGDRGAWRPRPGAKRGGRRGGADGLPSGGAGPAGSSGARGARRRTGERLPAIGTDAWRLKPGGRREWSRGDDGNSRRADRVLRSGPTPISP